MPAVDRSTVFEGSERTNCRARPGPTGAAGRYGREMVDAERRRRRLRHQPEPADGGGEPPTAATAEVHDGTPPPRARRVPGGEDGERGLRGLVGSGSSQVSVQAALRARDAARPTEQDLAEAEERLVIIRRNWVPREDLPRSGR